ncbi:hypothetical protein [Panacagrimonas sp.]|uniref:hypothetical protein n=1 Tax=Panacagrimonas sp. TaxID=2480088 RepID=UPI003B51A797
MTIKQRQRGTLPDQTQEERAVQVARCRRIANLLEQLADKLLASDPGDDADDQSEVVTQAFDLKEAARIVREHYAALINTPSPKKRGNPNMRRKANPLDVAFAYVSLRQAGDLKADAVAELADRFGISTDTVDIHIKRLAREVRDFADSEGVTIRDE